MDSIEGHVALITGGAHGIGAATARELVRRGARVVLVDLDRDALHAVADELGADRALAVVGDVRRLDQLQDAVARGVERFGGLDIAMANAGIAGFGSVAAIDPEAFRRVIDVNVNGVFHTVRAALPALVARRGYVLVVSSLAAYAASPGLVAYTTSKAASEHFANGLRPEIAHLGVQVGSAHMSWVDTPLVRDGLRDLPAFRTLMDSLPGPASRVTSLPACAKALADGIAERRGRINAPRWVELLRWIRPLLSTPLGERQSAKKAPEIVPRMDEEARALGRWTSARVEALESQPEAGSDLAGDHATAAGSRPGT